MIASAKKVAETKATTKQLENICAPIEPTTTYAIRN